MISYHFICYDIIHSRPPRRPVVDDMPIRYCTAIQCQKKIVYTSGEGSDIKKSKKVSKKIVYTSGEGSDTKKSKKVSKKNSLHFWGRV